MAKVGVIVHYGHYDGSFGLVSSSTQGNDGSALLEVHHIRRLADAGSNRVLPLLCAPKSSCSASVEDRTELRERLYAKVTRLERE